MVVVLASRDSNREIGKQQRLFFRGRPQFDMFVIGVTGGICSGKSSVARIICEKYSIELVDADKVGHEAYMKGTPRVIKDKLI